MDAAAPYTITHIARRAARYLRRLPRPQQESVDQAFKELCASPRRHTNPTVIRPLKGKYQGLWRYRLGGLRIVYAVYQKDRTISIVAIDQRGDVY